MSGNRVRVALLFLIIVSLLATPCHTGCSKLSKPKIMQPSILVPLTTHNSIQLSLKAGDRIVVEYWTDGEYNLDFWITHNEPIASDDFINMEDYRVEGVKQAKFAFFAPISTTYEIALRGPFTDPADRSLYVRLTQEAYLRIYINQNLN